MGNFSRRSILVVSERVLLSHNLFINKTVALLNSLAVIKDWSVSAPYSHLAGGMKYHDGKLTVPTPERYYIYAQLHYHNNGRTNTLLNNKVITMIQPPVKGAITDSGNLYTGVVLNLKAGDVISLVVVEYPVTSVKVYMRSCHSFLARFWFELGSAPNPRWLRWEHGQKSRTS